ncbi:hypothetical protein [Polyangium jinanense]|uniref:Uncharacterized protein n=1 Tax=Polyangium jinanense TaxID=2829994 RepID=A0A9X3XBC8_9BACT|nr:hypothetical protein [Polyangium jinanense]MDC3956795.1 hypothetical protein [Polyangium jinanense]MDC3987209.1 hypothetical protein [Polyangium jinanense]
MRNLTLGDLDIGLRDLLTDRKPNLTLLVCSQVYLPQILIQYAAIEALAPALAGRALADELAEADSLHDGFGGALWDYTEALLHAPDVSEATRAAARRIREALLPRRSLLADSYAEEAAAAKKNRPKLADLEPDLQSLPLPDGKTLHDWATGFVGAGDTIGKLLSARASAEADAQNDGKNNQLRKSTIKLLHRFREAARDEIELHASLPRDLESRVFGLFDELSARRAKRKTGGEEPPKGQGGTG